MEEKLTPSQLMMLNTGELAYLGDSIYDSAIRKGLILRGIRRNDRLVQAAQQYVSATAQAAILESIEEFFTEEEHRIISRGKNAKAKNTPKSATQKDYAAATALEALFGFLSLKNDTDRLDALIKIIFDKVGTL